MYSFPKSVSLLLKQSKAYLTNKPLKPKFKIDGLVLSLVE